MTRTLTPLFEGGNYFECPRWHEGRWWASDFYRHTVFTYDAAGREEPVSSRSRPSPPASGGCPTATCWWSR